MSRQSLLIWMLVVLVMFGLPIHYMDAAMTENRTRLTAEQSKLEPLRREVAALRDREAKLALQSAALEAVRNRLISAQPFATIQGELTAAAKQSGVTVSSLTLEGPAPVPDLADLVRYQATLQVAGNRTQYLEFLRLLENHRLLIELPEVDIRMLPQAVRGALPQVQQVLVLGFYSAGTKR